MTRRPRKPGRPRGTPAGQTTSRARLDLARAEEVELRNAVRRAEFVPVAEVKARWAARVIAFREAALNLVAVAVQRGLVRREDEGAFQDLVDQMLTKLSRRNDETGNPYTPAVPAAACRP